MEAGGEPRLELPTFANNLLQGRSPVAVAGIKSGRLGLCRVVEPVVWKLRVHVPMLYGLQMFDWYPQNYRKKSKSDAKNPFSGPNLASFARIDKPTNTSNPRTSVSDSGSSQDEFIRMLRPKIPKSSKNPQAVPKAQRMKTSFRRRRLMLTSEPA